MDAAAMELLLKSDKLSTELKELLGSSEPWIEDARPDRVLVQLAPASAAIQGEPEELPQFLASALIEQEDLIRHLPDGMGRLVELVPSLSEMVELVGCAQVIGIQKSADIVPHGVGSGEIVDEGLGKPQSSGGSNDSNH